MFDHTAKFVMFKNPYESVVNANNLIEIENIKAERGDELIEFVKNVVETRDYRVFPIIQEDLLEDGWRYSENYDEKKGRFKTGNYTGNKWGGKYLKAPNIFYMILEKGKDKLVKLGDIAEVKSGMRTGANSFFYLPSKYFGIEENGEYYRLIPKQNGLPADIEIEKEFLEPIIKFPRECKDIFVDPEKLNLKVFMCSKSKSELKGANALKYIEWGEKQIIKVKGGGKQGKKVRGYHELETMKGRKLWYKLSRLSSVDVLYRKNFNEIFNCPVNPNNILIDSSFYYASIKDRRDVLKFGFVLNSSLSWLFIELQGVKNMGEGVLTFSGPGIKSLIIFNPKNIKESSLKIFNKLCRRPVKSVYKELGIDPSKPIRDQEPNPLPDRKELDKIIFDELGLTKEERREVYWGVCELVKQRLEKAKG